MGFILIVIGLGLIGYGGYDAYNANHVASGGGAYFGFGLLLMAMGVVIIWLVLHTPPKR